MSLVLSYRTYLFYQHNNNNTFKTHYEFLQMITTKRTKSLFMFIKNILIENTNLHLLKNIMSTRRSIRLICLYGLVLFVISTILSILPTLNVYVIDKS